MLRISFTAALCLPYFLLFAQQVPPPDTISLSTALPPLTVTAQKRAETLTAVPLAVTALDAAAIQAGRTLNLSDLDGLVPNYQHKQVGVGFQALQSVRGVQVFSENPAVATYVDGVNYLDILAGGFPLTDIERIEVLRGPQGTLYGRNAMGGVINVITKAPTNRTEYSLLAEGGNLGHGRFTGSYRAPLVPSKLFVGVTGLYQTRNGFLTNDTTGTVAPLPGDSGRRVGDERTVYGNAKLSYLPTDDLRIVLDLKAQRDYSDASGFFVQQLTDSLALARPDAINLGVVGAHDRRIVTAALSAKYYRPGATLESISSLQSIGLSFANIESGGFRYFSLNDNELGGRPEAQRVYSQELRLNSEGSAPLQYTAGLYGFYQNAVEPTTNLAIQQGPDTYGVTRNVGRNYGVAAFGEIRYQLTEAWQLTAGLRYDREWREATFNGFGDAVLTGGELSELRADTTAGGTYGALSPKLALRYAPTERSSVYASYTRGFRAGGINTRRVTDAGNQQFDPEYSDNLEVGYKASFDNLPISVAAAAFWISWTDLQYFNVLPDFSFVRTNVGDATSRGVEVELSARPVAGLRLDASLGYNDTQYEDFVLTRFTGETNVGGNRLSNAPVTTLYTAVSYDWSLSERSTLQPRLEYRRIGEQFTDIQNDIRVAPYTLLNARLALTVGRYTFSAWGRNLTDERFLAYGSPDSSFTRRSRASAPRTYGLTLQLDY